MPNDIVWDDAPNDKGIVWDNSPPTPKKSETPLLERIQTGVMDPFVGAAQLMDKTGIPGAIRKGLGIESDMDSVVRERDANYQAPEGVDWGRMGGNVLNPIGWSGAPVTRLPLALKALSSTPLRAAASTAAAQSALTPTAADLGGTDFAIEKAKQLGMGAAGGAALGAVMKPLRGFKPTDEARALMDAGIQPSFGQAMGGKVDALEAGLASNAVTRPFVGGAINKARERPIKEFEGAVLNQVIPDAGPGFTLRGANEAVSNLYVEPVEALKRLSRDQVDDLRMNLYNEAATNPELSNEGQRALRKLGNYFLKQLEGPIDDGKLKALDSDIGVMIRKYAKGDPAQQAIADSLYKFQGGLRDQFEKRLTRDLPNGSELVSQLSDANRMYRDLVPANKAASANASGRILPRAYEQAVARQKNTDVSRLKDPLINNFNSVVGARGGDLGSELAQLQQALLTAAGLGGSAVGLGVVPTALLAGAIHGGATRPVQAMLTQNSPKLNKFGTDPATARLLAAALRGDQR